MQVMKIIGSLFFLSLMLLNMALAVAEPPKGIMTLTPKPAPGLVLSNMDGEKFDLTKSRGHWVFVHFWASWCVPCRQEMPTIEKAAAALEGSSLEFVLINTSETEDTVFNFMGIVAPDLSTLLDKDGQVTEAWQPRGLPSSYFIDPEGRQRYLALGGRPWDEKEYLAFLKQLGLLK